MWLHKERDNGKTVFAITLYAYSNKWYFPIGLAWWNRYPVSANSTCYYNHLIEISIGILFTRLQLQWWRKSNADRKGGE